MRMGIGGVAFAAACMALGLTGVAQASTHAAGSGHAAVLPADYNGCADGTACMYTDDGWDNSSPEQHWWTYGCYNLTNEYGDRYVYNNQYDNATVTLYTGTNCQDPYAVVSENTSWEGDISPINSISLDNP
jgi:hypothetical protein